MLTSSHAESGRWTPALAADLAVELELEGALDDAIAVIVRGEPDAPVAAPEDAPRRRRASTAPPVTTGVFPSRRRLVHRIDAAIDEAIDHAVDAAVDDALRAMAAGATERAVDDALDAMVRAASELAIDEALRRALPTATSSAAPTTARATDKLRASLALPAIPKPTRGKSAAAV